MGPVALTGSGGTSAAELEPMAFTQERMTPVTAPIEVVWEHVYRYGFAVRFAPGKDVLDVACGEGYGTAALAAAGARLVVGVDADQATCAYAAQKYGSYGIQVRAGDALALPLGAGSVDLVVSFETIEHLPDPAAFLDECRRVLRPDGTLVISTPNVDVFNPTRSTELNPYHCSEMTIGDFNAALAKRFEAVDEFVQRPTCTAKWHPRSLAGLNPWPAGRRGWGIPFRRCRVHGTAAIQRVRHDTVNAIVAPEPEPILGRLINPYRVRRKSWLPGEAPMYQIAVARRPR